MTVAQGTPAFQDALARLREDYPISTLIAERITRIMEDEVAALSAQVVELQKALQPFANYACDPPCECHNCKARMLIPPHSEVVVPPSVKDSGTC